MYLTSAAAAPLKGIAPVGACAGAGGGALAGTGPGGSTGVGAAADSCCSMPATTSRRRIEPPGPVPLIRVRSIPPAFASSSAPSVISTPIPRPPFGGGDCGVARLLEPLGDGPLRDRLTHFRQGDLHGRLGHDAILPSFQRLNLTAP